MNLEVLGLPTEKLNQFKSKNINTVNDLVHIYPKKYHDYSIPKNTRNIQSGEKCSMIVEVKGVYARKKYVEVVTRDYETGTQVRIKYFSMPYKYKELYGLHNVKAIVCGTFTRDDYGCSFINPSVFSTDIEKYKIIYPVYPSISKMSEEYYAETVRKALSIYDKDEEFSEDIRNDFKICTEKEMLQLIHHPKSVNDIVIARTRIVFKELYDLAYRMAVDSSSVQKLSTFKPIYLDNCNKLIKDFPYELTDDQKKFVSDFVSKGKNGERVNALLQGDVGCGKTVCAFLLMLAMSDNGYQSCLMAPTGVLARQHYEELKSFVEPMGLNCVYLSSELKVSERKKILEQISDGTAELVVGTHSVISDKVIFKNLGLTVVDEEHKFGVIQREALKNKADGGVHNITMSATPIPRSLALSLYGNGIDIFTIHTMPGGRKPIKTCVSNNDLAIFKFMEQQISEGHQCYIVCPLIEDDNNEDKVSATSVKEVANKVDNYFSSKNIKYSIVTGKMKDDEKNSVIADFKANKFQILISTTIIETGVNVPNATVMTIMDADRFGLAGLHQLRGRVGRSDLQSYCILKSTDTNNPRLEAMCDTTNGFELAKRDLEIRGTGDFMGTKQSGINRQVLLMMRYPQTYEKIKKIITIGDSLEF